MPGIPAEGVDVKITSCRRKAALRSVAFFILFFSLPVISAQVPLRLDDEDSLRGEDGIEITEFIFNETITKLGSDFYYHFFQNWYNPSDVVGLSIYIEERPIPGMGGIVTVKVEEQSVYQGFLRPGYQRILDAAVLAVEKTQEYMSNYEMIQKQLESEDHSGTGIF